MFVQKRRITAAEEIEEEVKEVEVAPEATELLFEAEDVAELIAEVTSKVVEVDVDGDDVIFTVDKDEFRITPDDDTELVESSVRTMRRPVKAGRRVARRAPVKSSRNVRRVRR